MQDAYLAIEHYNFTKESLCDMIKPSKRYRAEPDQEKGEKQDV